MKKILFTTFGGYPNKSVGGSTKIIFEILKNMNYTQFSPTFLSYDLIKKYNHPLNSLHNQKDFIFRQRKLGYKLAKHSDIYRNIVTSNYYLYIHYIKRGFYYTRKVSAFSSYDLIHSHDTFSAYYATRLKSPKKILTIHAKGSLASELIDGTYENISTSFLDDLKRKERTAFHNFDLVTFPSKGALELFLEDLQIRKYDSSKVRIIYNGVDTDSIKKIIPDNIFRKYNIVSPKADYILLNVAQHVKPKNIDVLIKAVDIIKNNYNKNVFLINVGEGYYTSELVELVNKLSLQNEVKFLGMICNDDVISLMKSCDFFVMPSERVVFDMVILEALASGITVIASNRGGNKEIIKNSINGYLIDSINPEMFAEKIVTAEKILQQKGVISSKSMYNEYNTIYQNLLE